MHLLCFAVRIGTTKLVRVRNRSLDIESSTALNKVGIKINKSLKLVYYINYRELVTC